MKPEIWFVDDEEELTHAYSEYLGEGYKSQVFSSAKAALAAFDASETRPDVIVTDLKMPELDGIGFMKKVRERNEHCSMIMMSGHADKEDLSEAMAHRAFSYLEKPFHPRVLLDQVQRATNAYRLDTLKERVLESVYAETKILRTLLENAIHRYTRAENSIYGHEVKLSREEAAEIIGNLSPERLLYRGLEDVQAEVKNLQKIISEIESTHS